MSETLTWNCLTNLADCFIFIWLNFYTMKFSRFIAVSHRLFNVVSNVIHLNMSLSRCQALFGSFFLSFPLRLPVSAASCFPALFLTAWLYYHIISCLSSSFLFLFYKLFTVCFCYLLTSFVVFRQLCYISILSFFCQYLFCLFFPFLFLHYIKRIFHCKT